MVPARIHRSGHQRVVPNPVDGPQTPLEQAQARSEVPTLLKGRRGRVLPRRSTHRLDPPERPGARLRQRRRGAPEPAAPQPGAFRRCPDHPRSRRGWHAPGSGKPPKPLPEPRVRPRAPPAVPAATPPPPPRPRGLAAVISTSARVAPSRPTLASRRRARSRSPPRVAPRMPRRSRARRPGRLTARRFASQAGPRRRTWGPERRRGARSPPHPAHRRRSAAAPPASLARPPTAGARPAARRTTSCRIHLTPARKNPRGTRRRSARQRPPSPPLRPEFQTVGCPVEQRHWRGGSGRPRSPHHPRPRTSARPERPRSGNGGPRTRACRPTEAPPDGRVSGPA